MCKKNQTFNWPEVLLEIVVRCISCSASGPVSGFVGEIKNYISFHVIKVAFISAKQAFTSV